jgi:hypothetical protein
VREEGSGTVFGLFLTIAILAVAGLVIDQSNAWRERTRMQVAADAAALAAATSIDNPVVGIERGLATAERILGDAGQISAEDFSFVSYDFETGSFVRDGDINAVIVEARRNEGRGNALPTHLLKLVGFNSWDMIVFSVACAAPAGGVDCAVAAIITSYFMDTGGGNTMNGRVCLHGETGILTGGNDWYDEDVRLSSGSVNRITVNSYSPSDLSLDDLRVEEDLSPVIVPQLQAIHNDLWDALYTSGVTEYSGDLLPRSIFDSEDPIPVVRVEGWWGIQPNALAENTIYVVNGGVQFAGAVDIENVAIISNQGIGVGGGFNLRFDNIFFMGTQLNLAGNVTWGPWFNTCDATEFGVYLLGTQSLSMGGWGNATSINGVIGAAPQFNPGGSMNASGVYFESTGYLPLGGDININGCGRPPLRSDWNSVVVPRIGGSSSRPLLLQ